ncbi:putative Gnk2-like domain-containing protein [Helianthus annuus]|nr:putative Gnk2-like domain-containing protein [Helianthus annuus]
MKLLGSPWHPLRNFCINSVGRVGLVGPGLIRGWNPRSRRLKKGLGMGKGGLGSADCEKCVKAAAEKGRSECGSSISGRVYLQQCYVSYKYNPNGVPGSGTGGGGGIQTGETETGGGGGQHNTQKTVALVIGGIAGLFLGIAFLLVLRSAFRKKEEKHSSFEGYH